MGIVHFLPSPVPPPARARRRVAAALAAPAPGSISCCSPCRCRAGRAPRASSGCPRKPRCAPAPTASSSGCWCRSTAKLGRARPAARSRPRSRFLDAARRGARWRSSRNRTRSTTRCGLRSRAGGRGAREMVAVEANLRCARAAQARRRIWSCAARPTAGSSCQRRRNLPGRFVNKGSWSATWWSRRELTGARGAAAGRHRDGAAEHPEAWK